MTRYDDDDHICAALKHGIDGYILKDQSDAGVKNLLRAVAKGEPGLSPEIMRQVLRQFESHELDTDDNQLPTIDRAREMGLTEREIEVLAHLSQGKDRHEVGEILSIRPSTVAGSSMFQPEPKQRWRPSSLAWLICLTRPQRAQRG
jgi:DNA-binding NarL/FixJ family response regulator